MTTNTTDGSQLLRRQSNAPRYYLDTCVLVNYFKTYNKTHGIRATMFLSRIQSGIYKGVVSDFCLIEFMRVLRRACYDIEGKRDPLVWEAEFKKAVEALFKMRNLEMISEKHFATSSGESPSFHMVLEEAARMMRTYHGRVEADSKLQFKYSGLSAADCIHVFLAKRYQCNGLATFDHGFEECKSEIMPLILDRNM